MYAAFRAHVRVVDHDKRDHIARELLTSLSPAKAPRAEAEAIKGKPLPASRTGILHSTDLLASSSGLDWWRDIDYETVKRARRYSARKRNLSVTNPFDSGFYMEDDSIGTVQEPSAALETHEALHQIKRKMPPAVSGNKPSLPPRSSSQSSLNPLLNASGTTGHPALNRKTSTASLLDDDTPDQAQRPDNRREATSEWQIITPNAVT